MRAEALFRFPVGGVVTAGPVVADGRVWVLSDAKTLYVLTVDGVAIGRRTTEERRSAFIACDSFGRAALSQGANGLILVNQAGREVWRVDLGAPPLGAPVFAPDGRMYVATSDAVLAWAPNGRLLWKEGLASRPSAQLAVGPGGGPVLALDDGSLRLYPPDGGKPEVVELGAPAMATVSGLDRVAVVLEDGSVLVPGEAGTGDKTAQLGAAPVSLAAAPEGFYTLGTDGTLLAVDANGAERWRIKPGLDGRGSSLAAFAGRVVVLSESSARSYGPDGSHYRTLRLVNSASRSAVSPGGAVFVGGQDWILYSYRFERALAELPRPAVGNLDMGEVDEAPARWALYTPSSHDEDVVMQSLFDIEKSLKSATIRGGERWTIAYLSAVALGRTDAPFGSGAVTVSPSPRGAVPRAYACGLLGSMGLAQAVPVLVEVFKGDADPVVRSAAASAVAAIGLDPEGRALEAFAGAVGASTDVRTASAVVDAVEELYRASGALDDRAGILALVRIAGGNYPRDLRSKAEKALRRVSSAR
jgi:outer membrane protein assembly factor BamB